MIENSIGNVLENFSRYFIYIILMHFQLTKTNKNKLKIFNAQYNNLIIYIEQNI